MSSHVAVETDVVGNPKPSKKKSTERIDCTGAAIMVLGRALVQAPADGGICVSLDPELSARARV